VKKKVSVIMKNTGILHWNEVTSTPVEDKPASQREYKEEKK